MVHKKKSKKIDSFSVFVERGKQLVKLFVVPSMKKGLWLLKDRYNNVYSVGTPKQIEKDIDKGIKRRIYITKVE